MRPAAKPWRTLNWDVDVGDCEDPPTLGEFPDYINSRIFFDHRHISADSRAPGDDMTLGLVNTPKLDLDINRCMPAFLALNLAGDTGKASKCCVFPSPLWAIGNLQTALMPSMSSRVKSGH